MTKLNLICTTSVITLLLFASVFYGSCKKDVSENKCVNVVCANGGECKDGKCICKSGYEGANCELYWFTKFIGIWKMTHKFHDGNQTIQRTYTVVIKPTTTDATVILIDDFFGTANYDNVICNLTSSKTFSLKENQTLAQNEFVVKSGNATIDDLGIKITGSFTANLAWYGPTAERDITFEMIKQ